MKKHFTIIIFILSFSNLIAQTDSAKVDSTKKKHKLEFDFSVSLTSRNYCRGANFGDGPTIQPSIEVAYRGFYVGAFGSITQNNSYNYGNTIDAYLGYKAWRLNFSVHDYFFFNKNWDNNDFWFHAGQNSGKDGHYYEGQVKYQDNFLSLLVAYNFYNTTTPIFPTTFYIESQAKITEEFSLIFAMTTGASAVNFYGNTYDQGVSATCIGVNYNKEIKLSKKFDTELSLMAHYNPNYKNISPDLQQTPVNLIIGLKFN